MNVLRVTERLQDWLDYNTYKTTTLNLARIGSPYLCYYLCHLLHFIQYDYMVHLFCIRANIYTLELGLCRQLRAGTFSLSSSSGVLSSTSGRIRTTTIYAIKAVKDRIFQRKALAEHLRLLSEQPQESPETHCNVFVNTTHANVSVLLQFKTYSGDKILSTNKAWLVRLIGCLCR